VGDNIRNFVGSNSSGFNFAELKFGLSILDFKQRDAPLDIIEKAVVLIGLGDSDYVHDSNGELDISSSFVIHFNAIFSVLNDDVSFAGSESKS
jgi:hypothetical protein